MGTGLRLAGAIFLPGSPTAPPGGRQAYHKAPRRRKTDFPALSSAISSAAGGPLAAFGEITSNQHKICDNCAVLPDANYRTPRKTHRQKEVPLILGAISLIALFLRMMPQRLQVNGSEKVGRCANDKSKRNVSKLTYLSPSEVLRPPGSREESGMWPIRPGATREREGVGLARRAPPVGRQ